MILLQGIAVKKTKDTQVMIELNATFTSTRQSVTEIRAYQEKSAAVLMAGKTKQASPLNAQERQIVDDVGISGEAMKQLQQARELENQLREYLDYLKGRGAGDKISIKPAGDNGDMVIAAGPSTRSAAAIRVERTDKTEVSISAKFDGSGNLQTLAIDAQRERTDSFQISAITRQQGFFAAAA
jgi:hypothetical protein